MFIAFSVNDEPEELIRYAALIHNSGDDGGQH
jgi:hypothetical protein